MHQDITYDQACNVSFVPTARFGGLREAEQQVISEFEFQEIKKC